MSFDLKSQKTLLLFVLLATALIYVSSLRYEFTYDDNSQIVLNPAITSAAHIPEYFTKHVWETIDPGAAPLYYRPVFLLWLLLNYKLFGLSPAGWHATNLIVHLLATWLVFVLARRLTSDHLIATIAAFLFGIHPVHVESVAWISGVTDPLMTVFFVAAIVLYLDTNSANEVTPERSEENGPRFFNQSLVLSLLFYSLAILTKETAVVFLPMLICYELLLGKQRSQSSTRTRLISMFLTMLPYLIVTVVYLFVRFRVLGALGHQLTQLPATTIASTIPSVLWFYLNHLIWPRPLSAFYDNTYVSGGWLLWGPLIGLIVVASMFVLLGRRSKQIMFLGCWMVVPILPSLNLSLFKFGEIVHDRYLYLPSVGFCIVLSAVFFHVIRTYSKYKHLAVVILLVIGSGWALETVIQLPMWKNDLALYTHGAAVAPQNNLAINNLAATLKSLGDVDRAITLSRQVLDRDPNNWRSLYNLGHSYYTIGDFAEATKYLGQAISLNPSAPDQYLFYGLAAMRKGQITDAEAALRTAVRLRPANARYRFALGVLLKQKGDLPDATVELAKSIELDRSIEANARLLLAEIESQGKRSN
ncbi:MAG TPA: tetratricopeptide repeat protein [Pyrinomonadaceae bacterium]|nr:tetratricopeptide repeat protein [Pyrinomonadaceae bacterium]